MKAQSARRNTVVFLTTMFLIASIGLGVLASSKLLTHWLLIRNISLDLTDFETHLAKQQTDWFESVRASNAPPEEAGALRLSTTGIVPKGVTSAGIEVTPLSDEVFARFLELADDEMSPSHVVSARYVSAPETADAPVFRADLDAVMASFTGHKFPEQEIVRVLQYMPSAERAYSDISFSWISQAERHSILVIPDTVDGKTVGAVLLEADHSERERSLSLVAKISTGVIALLCISSFLISGFLLWLRFHEQVKTNQDIEFLAHHDSLTGLPNRAVFNTRLNEALRLANASASNIAVMLIDVDKFKDINDTYGHGVGDLFLQVISDRLKSVFGDHLVARLSGDEFAVLVQSVQDVARLTKLAGQMMASTEAPCTIDGKEIRISLSIGIARASDGSWRASRLLHCADLALYRAKHSGRSTFTWYTPDMDSDAQKRKEVEEGLEKALKFDQFQLFYQPQFSLIDKKLKGYESLIRWEHPIKGTISPEIFIPVAEDCGLIEAIGDWVLMKACEEATTWEDQSLRVAVNVSAAQFQARETQEKVRRALEATGLAPERLEIEITESLLISDTDAVVETLQEIKDMGVSIAMDDFGTGYSSLSYLSRFPFDKIKIDRSFIQNLGKDISTDAIVTSIVGLGRSLDVQITAEGVETEEQSTLLTAAGCHLVQGYLYGRPGSLDTIRKQQRAEIERWAAAEALVADHAMNEVENIEQVRVAGVSAA